MIKFLKTSFCFLFIIFICFICLKPLLKADDDKKIAALFFELDSAKINQERSEKISQILKSSSPDIAIFAGIDSIEDLNTLISSQSSYSYSYFDKNDSKDFLLFLSRIKPENVSFQKGQYKIKNDKKNTEETLETKSFIVAKFAIDNYTFFAIAAKVKDQKPDPEFNQFDMRRYEIRQLRYVFDNIQKENPEANIVILANLNDTCEMSTVKEIYARRYSNKKRVFDVRPIDKLKTTWTYWQKESDEYLRTSYALLSYHMLPELIRDETTIIWRDDWLSISHHRPIYVKFVAAEMQEYSDKYLAAIYENSIYSEIAAHFEKDKIIGEKPKRKSPESEKKQKK